MIVNPGFGIYPSEDGYYRGDDCILGGQDGPEDEWIEAIDSKYAMPQPITAKKKRK